MDKPKAYGGPSPTDDVSLVHFEKLKEREEIKIALSTEVLEDCPFCDFAMIIPFTFMELPDFYCMGCGVDSCRRCKKSHPRELCKDLADALRSTEEAKTQALVRYCPGCNTPFIQIDGTNFWKCSCGTKSCYSCRKKVSSKVFHYSIFKPLWTRFPKRCSNKYANEAEMEIKHNKEVQEAEKKARAKLLPKT
ncbi:hypothetical protein M422DRAFT_51810 [Sphaerobolus stellatus SS14]|uniref:RING-type domain-containing protein n=1 Tax=Sphaerobolus stellatus (strain SS14) TaxID=990650 RepID=A0A0C9VC43_SPHS4|nr:hypothetical protein M422DRAFT_51810 [Sphaerobolus stellatus SS14]